MVILNGKKKEKVNAEEANIWRKRERKGAN